MVYTFCEMADGLWKEHSLGGEPSATQACAERGVAAVSHTDAL